MDAMPDTPITCCSMWPWAGYFTSLMSPQLCNKIKHPYLSRGMWGRNEIRLMTCHKGIMPALGQCMAPSVWSSVHGPQRNIASPPLGIILALRVALGLVSVLGLKILREECGFWLVSAGELKLFLE